MSRPLALVLLLCALALGACGEDDEEGSAAKTPSGPAQDTKTADASPGGGCEQVQPPTPKPDGGREQPKAALPEGKRYELTFETSCGRFTVRVDQRAAPKTAASVVALARSGFYDSTVFHRIVPGFVIQGGDPTGTGSGGPGYSVVDRPPAGVAYTKGVVAMAKTAQEAPGTSGSQFYVVTGPDAGLPAEYAVLGKVTDGIEVIEQIGELGDPASGGTGVPLQTVVLERVAVSER